MMPDATHPETHAVQHGSLSHAARACRRGTKKGRHLVDAASLAAGGVAFLLNRQMLPMQAAHDGAVLAAQPSAHQPDRGLLGPRPAHHHHRLHTFQMRRQVRCATAWSSYGAGQRIAVAQGWGCGAGFVICVGWVEGCVRGAAGSWQGPGGHQGAALEQSQVTAELHQRGALGSKGMRLMEEVLQQLPHAGLQHNPGSATMLHLSEGHANANAAWRIGCSRHDAH